MSLKPGNKGEPLPPDEVVIRLAMMEPSRYAETGEVDAAAFTLSDDERDSDDKWISVWAKELTTPEQARSFMSRGQAYRLALYLRVSAIHDARPRPDSPAVPYLRCLWDPRYIEQDGRVILDPRPGAAGHAGISGLNRLPALEDAKRIYKSLREELARCVHDTERLD